MRVAYGSEETRKLPMVLLSRCRSIFECRRRVSTSDLSRKIVSDVLFRPPPMCYCLKNIKNIKETYLVKIFNDPKAKNILAV